MRKKLGKTKKLLCEKMMVLLDSFLVWKFPNFPWKVSLTGKIHANLKLWKGTSQESP
ncbi:MAG: hypothetical protein WBE60_11030 [Nitrosotalea sp.]